MAEDKREQTNPTPSETTGAQAARRQPRCPDVPRSPAVEAALKGSLRRLLSALTEELERLADAAPDAAKKFSEELKEGEKEYQGIPATLKKYEDLYPTLDAQLTEAGTVSQAIADWSQGKVPDAIRSAIRRLWEEQYQKKDTALGSKWGQSRNTFHALHDCVRQSERMIEDLREDLEGLKNLDKTFKERFAELKSLHDKAKACRDAGQYQSVYGIELEYRQVFDHLFAVPVRARRPADPSAAAAPTATASTRSCPPAPPKLPPAELRNRLTAALRDLILGQFDRFWRHREWLAAEAETRRSKEAWEKFRKTRREEFILEAEEVTAEAA